MLDFGRRAGPGGEVCLHPHRFVAVLDSVDTGSAPLVGVFFACDFGKFHLPVFLVMLHQQFGQKISRFPIT